MNETSLTAPELALRHEIFGAFAATGEPPDVGGDPALGALAAAHVIVLDGDGQIAMAHPFAGHHRGARVDAGGRTWWGNCAWDGLGIVAALGLRNAAVSSNGITVGVVDGQPNGDVVFHVAVPARHWWEDIAFT